MLRPSHRAATTQAHPLRHGLAEQIAAQCIRELARDIKDLNARIAALDEQIADLLAEHGNPVADLLGAGD